MKPQPRRSRQPLSLRSDAPSNVRADTTFALIKADIQRNRNGLQDEAINRAKAAYAKLPNGNEILSRCRASSNPIDELVKQLEEKHQQRKSKKLSRLLHCFYRNTAVLHNYSKIIDVVVQTEAGLGCPIWAPVKFILEVRRQLFLANCATFWLTFSVISCPTFTPKLQSSLKHLSQSFRKIYQGCICTRALTQARSYKMPY